MCLHDARTNFAFVHHHGGKKLQFGGESLTVVRLASGVMHHFVWYTDPTIFDIK